jgi:hypothetical protein
MSAYILYKLAKLGVFFVLAVIYGFIRARAERRKSSQHSEARD